MRHGSVALVVVLLALGQKGAAADPAPLAAAPSTTAEAPTTVAAPLSGEALAELVAPVALYPDDLLGIVLPASTYPLQVVQAARFLEALKTDPTQKPDPAWDDSIVALLNYPEVVALLDNDIDWTWRLGEAVLNQHDDVVAAVADFRERASVAGNLKSDDRQVVTRNDGAIEIRPANPQVIYVPYYEPSQVVVYQPAPVYYYYPRPYPVYYYPYPVGYDFYSPYFWGVTSIFSIAWASHHVHICHVHHHHHRYYGHHYYDDHYYYRHPYRHHHGGYAYWGRSYDRYGYDDDVWRPDRRYSGGRPGGRHDRDDYADRDHRDRERTDRDYASRNQRPGDPPSAGDSGRNRDGERAPRAGGERPGERQWNADRAGAPDTRNRTRDSERTRDSAPRLADRSGVDTVSGGSASRQRLAPTAPRNTQRLGFAPRQGDRPVSRESGTVRRWQGSGPRSNSIGRSAAPVAASPNAYSAARSPQNAFAPGTRVQHRATQSASADPVRAEPPRRGVAAAPQRPNVHVNPSQPGRAAFAPPRRDGQPSETRSVPRIADARARAPEARASFAPRRQAIPRERPAAPSRGPESQSSDNRAAHAPPRRENPGPQRAERGGRGDNDRGGSEGRSGWRAAQR